MAYVFLSSIVRRKQSSPEPMPRREPVPKPEVLTNGNHGPSHAAQEQNFTISSPESLDSDDDDDDDEYDNTDNLDRRCVVFVSSKSVVMPSIKILTNSLFLTTVVVEEGNLSGIQRMSLLKKYQIMRQSLKVMMILLERLYMMKNISRNVSRKGSILAALKEMKNISGMMII